MERRKLLIYSFLIVLGVAFAPSTTFAENGNIIIPLPKADEHVRQGNFNFTDNSGMQLPDGVSNLKYQRFYKSGFADSPDDLCIVSFIYNEETVIIQFKFFELCEKGYLNCSGTGKSSNNIFRLI